jgi:hypothetical protein
MVLLRRNPTGRMPIDISSDIAKGQQFREMHTPVIFQCLELTDFVYVLLKPISKSHCAGE